MMVDSSYEIHGPFEVRPVTVNGWIVNRLEAHPENGGMVYLSFDNRFGYLATAQEAERLIPWLADCLAVAGGYTSHPGPGHALDYPGKVERNAQMPGPVLPFAHVVQIGDIESEPAGSGER